MRCWEAGAQGPNVGGVAREGFLAEGGSAQGLEGGRERRAGEGEERAHVVFWWSFFVLVCCILIWGVSLVG